jgi:membrane protease YdiL (CAAX protease family)
MAETYQVLAGLVTLLAVGASLATLFWLFQKHIDGRPLVEFEPRRPAPWNGLAPASMLALSLVTTAAVLMGLADASSADSPADEVAVASSAAAVSAAGASTTSYAAAAAEASAIDARSFPQTGMTIGSLWATAGVNVLITLTCYVALGSFVGATYQDLGLPESWAQARQDAALGAQTFVASLAPVYGIQIVLTTAFEPEQMHPLIEQLKVVHTPAMMLAAFVVAAVSAPLFEETAFRLVFQGWLERVQMIAPDRRRRWANGSPSITAPAVEEPPTDLAAAAASHAAPTRPGWAPIVISALVFATAHLGHGVAPVSLFALGVALGYVYQRTHRVLPSMVCHALFNGFSLLMLWLSLAGGNP